MAGVVAGAHVSLSTTDSAAKSDLRKDHFSRNLRTVFSLAWSHPEAVKTNREQQDAARLLESGAEHLDTVGCVPEVVIVRDGPKLQTGA